MNANEILRSEIEWERLCPLIDEEAINGKTETAIFKLLSKGVETNRDGWMYDLSVVNLESKITYLIENDTIANRGAQYHDGIESSPNSENNLSTGLQKEYNKSNVLTAAFRPFCKQYFYFDEYLISKTYQWSKISKNKNGNIFLAINSPSNSQNFFCLSADTICDVHFTGDSQCFPLYWYSKEELRQDNITDWALQIFTDYYLPNLPSSPVCYAGNAELRDEFRQDIPLVKPITKEDIFHYIYAVLHHPAYRKKYELDLKRDFPRIPLYNNFQQWSDWGKRLMDLHINYETATPYPLERRDMVIEPKAGVTLDYSFEVRLKAYKEEGKIKMDAFTTLSGIPKVAWDYKLGNRSALEWILNQYKEKKPSDPILAEQFNTYRFRDYKEQVVDLLKRVCTVSVETMRIVGEMP